jgi:hypothetical protein
MKYSFSSKKKDIYYDNTHHVSKYKEYKLRSKLKFSKLNYVYIIVNNVKSILMDSSIR